MLTLRDIVQANKTSFVAVNLNFTICQRETEFKKFFGSKLNLKIENQRIKSSKVSKQKRKRVFCCLHCVVISVFKNKSKFSFQTRKEHKGNCPHIPCGVDSINVSSYRALLFRTVPKQEKQKNDGLGARYIELLFLEKFKS